MASSNSSGFSLWHGASIPGDLGQALAFQMRRWFPVRDALSAEADDGFAGPDFMALTPDLVHEIGRG